VFALSELLMGVMVKTGRTWTALCCCPRKGKIEESLPFAALRKLAEYAWQIRIKCSPIRQDREELSWRGAVDEC
jgi:hypothetical protein